MHIPTLPVTCVEKCSSPARYGDVICLFTPPTPSEKGRGQNFGAPALVAVVIFVFVSPLQHLIGVGVLSEEMAGGGGGK